MHLKEALNAGVLPTGYYAMSEQHFGRAIADILTLETTRSATRQPEGGPTVGGAVAIVDALPQVTEQFVVSPEAAARARRRTLVIRHASDHRVVAFLEIVSPGNKDGQAHLSEFVSKAASALDLGLHLLVVDLFPPGPHDTQRIAGAICNELSVAFANSEGGPDPLRRIVASRKRLTLASFVAAPSGVTVYLEALSVGDPLPEMPLFLSPDRYVNVPLERTYQAAYRGMPEYWRDVVEGRSST
ncbi:MAG: DUF4058 family protein [Planctomycetia bacterium]|nr:DUF4058 family protein [Planctomycetia bacterium]